METQRSGGGFSALFPAVPTFEKKKRGGGEVLCKNVLKAIPPNQRAKALEGDVWMKTPAAGMLILFLRRKSKVVRQKKKETSKEFYFLFLNPFASF